MPLTARKLPIKSPPKRAKYSPAPTGWKVTGAGVEQDESILFVGSNLRKHYQDIWSWAIANKVHLRPDGYARINYNEWSMVYVWTKFQIYQGHHERNNTLFGDSSCWNCGTSVRMGAVFCSNSDCNLLLSCAGCSVAGLKLHGMGTNGQAYCAKCCRRCVTATCDGLVVPNDAYKTCTKCTPRAACSVCKTVHQTKLLKPHYNKTKKYQLCKTCVGKICQKCNVPSPSVAKIPSTKGVFCEDCAKKLYAEKRKEFEAWSEDEMPITGSMLIPSSSVRPVRTISIETEFNGSGAKVGTALFEAGLSASPGLDRYGSQGQSNRHPCFLKVDGTVTGGELVTYLLDLNVENHAAALLRMTEVMKGCREVGDAQFTSNAGGHIHIDLHGYSVEDLWAYYTIFKYLEMPIYYLAGAGAEYGHRSLTGNGMSASPRYGPFGTVQAFAQTMQSSGRSALNISNFWHQIMNACACGARITGSWKTCSCNLGKATAEWRVWNSEITPKILHAWLSLMIALTAYAEDFGMTKEKESKFPYLPWQGTSFKKVHSEPIKTRLEWIHKELPLTNEERDSIVYALKRSELISLGKDYLDSLLKLPNVGGISKKQPRNPLSRKGTTFNLKGGQ